MTKAVRKGWVWAVSIVSLLLAIIPEDFFKIWKFNPTWSEIANVIFNRIILFFAAFVIAFIVCLAFVRIRRHVNIDKDDCLITVKYGDILNPFPQRHHLQKIFQKLNDCYKVIAFDECFTTKIGTAPEDIREGSICGQYLKNNLGKFQV